MFDLYSLVFEVNSEEAFPLILHLSLRKTVHIMVLATDRAFVQILFLITLTAIMSATDVAAGDDAHHSDAEEDRDDDDSCN